MRSRAFAACPAVRTMRDLHDASSRAAGRQQDLEDLHLRLPVQHHRQCVHQEAGVAPPYPHQRRTQSGGHRLARLQDQAREERRGVSVAGGETCTAASMPRPATRAFHWWQIANRHTDLQTCRGADLLSCSPRLRSPASGRCPLGCPAPPRCLRSAQGGRQAATQLRLTPSWLQ